jgi:hypothetical protein
MTLALHSPLQNTNAPQAVPVCCTNSSQSTPVNSTSFVLKGGTVRKLHVSRTSTLVMSVSCVMLCFIFITRCVLRTSLFYGHSESQSATSPAWLNRFQALVTFWVFEILGQWDVIHKPLTASLNGTLPILVATLN